MNEQDTWVSSLENWENKVRDIMVNQLTLRKITSKETLQHLIYDTSLIRKAYALYTTYSVPIYYRKNTTVNPTTPHPPRKVYLRINKYHTRTTAYVRTHMYVITLGVDASGKGWRDGSQTLSPLSVLGSGNVTHRYVHTYTQVDVFV